MFIIAVSGSPTDVVPVNHNVIHKGGYEFALAYISVLFC